MNHVSAQNNREEKSFRNLTIIMQNMIHNLLLFSAPTCPSYHVIENHLYSKNIIHLSVGESGGYLPPLR